MLYEYADGGKADKMVLGPITVMRMGVGLGIERQQADHGAIDRQPAFESKHGPLLPADDSGVSGAKDSWWAMLTANKVSLDAGVFAYYNPYVLQEMSAPSNPRFVVATNHSREAGGSQVPARKRTSQLQPDLTQLFASVEGIQHAVSHLLTCLLSAAHARLQQRGSTALYWASERGDTNAVRTLLNSADSVSILRVAILSVLPSFQDLRTPLHYASRFGLLPFVRLLLPLVDVTQRDIVSVTHAFLTCCRYRKEGQR